MGKQKTNLLENSSRREYNERKFDVLSIVRRDGVKSKYKLAEELKISVHNAEGLLYHYHKWGLLKIAYKRPHINPGTGRNMPGRPYNVYALTDKGHRRLDDLTINRLRGLPLNLKNYPPARKLGELADFTEGEEPK